MQVPRFDVILHHAGTQLARATLPPGEYVIGREPGVDVRAETPLLSRRHARLTINYDHLLLEDLASSNGTFVNGQPLAPSESIRLFPNQPVRLGPDITLEIRRQRPESAPDASLTPEQAAIERLVPADVRSERRYAIGSIVARGGMGAILDARQAAMQRQVAMKVMLESAAPADLARFVDEARITGQLEHPNIVPVHELGVDENGQLFYTMKFVRGSTLKKVLADLAADDAVAVEKYPLPALLTVFQKACDALAFAHSRGVIHRDLKPENIMLGDFGEVLVMDWGLAKVVGRNDADAAARSSAILSARATGDDASFTMDGAIMGTPAYMSPEQARGEIEMLDARSDIYALGAIFFEILNLRPAYTGRSAMEIVDKVGRGEAEWAAVGRALRLPHSLAAVVRKAMAFEMAARYRSVEGLQADLLAYQNGFATSAENAGLGKQLLLALRRHKAVSIATAAALTLLTGVSTAFTLKVIGERNRAERALGDLRKAAPTLAAQAQTLVEEQKFDEAIEKLGFALAIDPQNPDYRLRRAHLLQATLRLKDAAADYRSVLTLRPDESASANLALCEKVQAQWPASGEADPKILRDLFDALRAQGRNMESVPLAHRLGLGTQATADTLNAAFGEWMKLPGWKTKEGDRLHRNLDGSYDLLLWNLPVQDLSPFLKLRGLPISAVELHDTRVSDLKPLAGLPLHKLGLEQTPVSDLSGLEGMPLEGLSLSGTKVRSLEPLREMPLTKLSIEGCSEIEDLAPLTGMPLRNLNIKNCKKIESLKRLSGLPLQSLTIADCRKIKSLDGLQKSPLQNLNLEGTSISDLTPLRGLPLHSVRIQITLVTSLAGLEGAPIESLAAWNTYSLRDISALRGSPLRSIDLSQCVSIRDLSPLADCLELTTAALPSLKTPGLEKLRTLPKLQWIGIWEGQEKPAAEFWAEYDAQQANRARFEKNLAQVRAALPALGMIATDRTKVVEPWGVYADLLEQPVTDVTGLRQLPIDYLSLHKTKVTDLAPLRGMRLKQICFDATPVKDVSPLLDLPILEAAMVPQAATNLEVLRRHPTLKYLGWEKDWDDGNNRPKLTTAEFWARYDAQRAAEKK